VERVERFESRSFRLPAPRSHVNPDPAGRFRLQPAIKHSWECPQEFQDGFVPLRLQMIDRWCLSGNKSWLTTLASKPQQTAIHLHCFKPGSRALAHATQPPSTGKTQAAITHSSMRRPLQRSRGRGWCSRRRRGCQSPHPTDTAKRSGPLALAPRLLSPARLVCVAEPQFP